MSTKGAQFLHLACQGVQLAPCPPSVTPLRTACLGHFAAESAKLQ